CFQAEDGIRGFHVTGVQTCALPIFLEVVAAAGDVCGDLDLARRLDASDLPQGRVRLTGGRRVDARAHAAALRAPLESRRLRLVRLGLPALADQLLDRGHYVSVSVG